MGMYDTERRTHEVDGWIAGSAYITKESGTVDDGVEIAARSLVKHKDGFIVPLTAEDLVPEVVNTGGDPGAATVVRGIDDLYGLAAADASNGTVALYLTGEFFADKLVLPDGVSIDNVLMPLRRLGIFLK